MISISKDVGALAHCVAHRMEDKMRRKIEKKKQRGKGDGGGGDEKSVVKLVDVLFGILLGEPANNMISSCQLQVAPHCTSFSAEKL